MLVPLGIRHAITMDRPTNFSEFRLKFVIKYRSSGSILCSSSGIIMPFSFPQISVADMENRKKKFMSPE
jgi:hypothetical protein